MFSKLLSWLRTVPPDRRAEFFAAERSLRDKMAALDKTVACTAEKVERTRVLADEQVLEAEAAMQTVRSLMDLVGREDRK
jgi:hypothetical protein